MTYAWAKGSDRRWRELRARRLKVEPLCRMCRPKLVIATEVDHVLPVSQGGAKYSFENTQSLCHDHHAAKTTSERTGKPMRIKGCDAQGFPLDPSHSWSRST